MTTDIYLVRMLGNDDEFYTVFITTQQEVAERYLEELKPFCKAHIRVQQMQQQVPKYTLIKVHSDWSTDFKPRVFFKDTTETQEPNLFIPVSEYKQYTAVLCFPFGEATKEKAIEMFETYIRLYSSRTEHTSIQIDGSITFTATEDGRGYTISESKLKAQ